MRNGFVMGLSWVTRWKSSVSGWESFCQWRSYWEKHLLTTCLSTGFSNPSESSPVSPENLPLDLFPQENLRKPLESHQSRATRRESPSSLAISSEACSASAPDASAGINFTSFLEDFAQKTRNMPTWNCNSWKDLVLFPRSRKVQVRAVFKMREKGLVDYPFVGLMSLSHGHLMIYNHVMYVQLASGFNPRSTKGNRKTVLWASQKTHQRICHLWDMPWSFWFPWWH